MQVPIDHSGIPRNAMKPEPPPPPIDGVELGMVEHPARDREAAGSNPVAPTRKDDDGRIPWRRYLAEEKAAGGPKIDIAELMPVEFPSKDELLREIDASLEQAKRDPFFALVLHHGLEITYDGRGARRIAVHP